MLLNVAKLKSGCLSADGRLFPYFRTGGWKTY